MRPSKRDELVQKALDTFYQNGFNSTGMDMLVRETGVSKTSIYNHFHTKDELILAALRLRDEKFRNWLYRRMEELAPDPKGQLIALFDALAEWFKEPSFSGCMFVKASAEFQDPNNLIHKHCSEHKRIVEVHLLKLARSAGLEDPQKLVRKLMLLKEGAIILAQLGQTGCPAAEAKEAAQTFIELASLAQDNLTNIAR